jgi:hypothetical protein
LLRLLGIPISLDASWPIILALLTWTLIDLFREAVPEPITLARLAQGAALKMRSLKRWSCLHSTPSRLAPYPFRERSSCHNASDQTMKQFTNVEEEWARSGSKSQTYCLITGGFALVFALVCLCLVLPWFQDIMSEKTAGSALVCLCPGSFAGFAVCLGLSLPLLAG